MDEDELEDQGVEDDEEEEDIEALIPDSGEMRAMLTWAIEYWTPRNLFIDEQRRSVEGLNLIEMPQSTQYAAQAVHMYSETAMINEKVSRYLHQPTFKTLVEDPEDEDEADRLERIEKWLNIHTFEVERLGDGDVYDRTINDVHLLDMGIYKLVCAPGPNWKEIVVPGSEVKYPMESKQREAYKKNQGTPIRRLYVPLELWLPQYDGSRLDWSLEIEARTLHSCKSNPLFDKEAIDRLTVDTAGGRSSILPLVHYCDDEFYATFCLTPQAYTAGTQYNIKPANLGAGPLTFLWGTRHKAGRSMYVAYSGRYGGWKTQLNRIEGINKGIMTISGRIDEVMSQVYTNIRAKYWPNLKWTIDPELRGHTPGANVPDPPQLKEGQAITLFKGEDLAPIFLPSDDPMTQWYHGELHKAMEKLGGGPSLYGQPQPGVETGYHNAQSIDQAEHLEEKTEQHIVQGAIEDAVITMNYVKAIGEKVWACAPEAEEGGKKIARYVSLEPADLFPLPRIDAQVRKPRPIDYLAALRAAKEASDEREGKGPVMSTYRIRTEILSMTHARAMEEERMTRLEAQRNKIWNSDIINEKVAIALNLKLAQRGVPQVTQGTVQNAAPAVQQAVTAIAGGPAAQQGGVSGQTLAHINGQRNGPPTRITSEHTGGRVATDSQPEARVGEALNGATGLRP